MKKLLLLLFVFIILTSLNYAQFVRGYGIKVGLTISQQNWQYSYPFSSAGNDYKKNGFNAGVFAEFLNIPFISFVTELNYIQKGMKKDIPVTTADNPDGSGKLIAWDGSINYFNISALGKLRTSLGILNPYIALGPKMDFELNRNSSLDQMKDFKKNRIGAKVGFGSEISLQTFSLLVEFMYDTDFSKLNDTQYLKIKTHSYDLRVGVMF